MCHNMPVVAYKALKKADNNQAGFSILLSSPWHRFDHEKGVRGRHWDRGKV